MAGKGKIIRETMQRAAREALVYGCTVELAGTHMRILITAPSGKKDIHSFGLSPKNFGAMVDGVGKAVRRKCRAMVGLGPTG
jgi:hypothetical protein